MFRCCRTTWRSHETSIDSCFHGRRHLTLYVNIFNSNLDFIQCFCPPNLCSAILHDYLKFSVNSNFIVLYFVCISTIFHSLLSLLSLCFTLSLSLSVSLSSLSPLSLSILSLSSLSPLSPCLSLAPLSLSPLSLSVWTSSDENPRSVPESISSSPVTSSVSHTRGLFLWWGSVIVCSLVLVPLCLWFCVLPTPRADLLQGRYV